jgi:maltose O-acetyltransferase
MAEPSEKEKMLAGEPYRSGDAALEEERRHAKLLCAEYNRHVGELDRRTLARLLGYETDAWLEPPFFCDYGYNLRLGGNVYANHNFIVLDGAPVTIGDNVLFANNVTLTTATHPTDPVLRVAGIEYAYPITIGSNVWLGAGVIVLPGVTIGDNTTIGAGSVVTRSIPANAIAYGNPARVERTLDSGQAN